MRPSRDPLGAILETSRGLLGPLQKLPEGPQRAPRRPSEGPERVQIDTPTESPGRALPGDSVGVSIWTLSGPSEGRLGALWGPSGSFWRGPRRPRDVSKMAPRGSREGLILLLLLFLLFLILFSPLPHPSSLPLLFPPSHGSEIPFFAPALPDHLNAPGRRSWMGWWGYAKRQEFSKIGLRLGKGLGPIWTS